MSKPASLREQMLAALNCQDAHYPPVSFMLFKGLWSQSQSYLDFIQSQIDLGLNPYVQIPMRQPGIINDHYNLHGLPISYHPGVKVQEWRETQTGEDAPVLVKEYHTPAGILRTEVRQTEDWPYGDHVPLLDDHLVPRSRKFIISNFTDLDALAYLLVEPNETEAKNFVRESQPAIEFARQKDLLLAGGWGVGADLVGWVYGLSNMVYAVYDQPDFIKSLLELIASWNRARMRVILETGLDLYIKRAWYENCDFFTPTTYKEFIAPILKKDIELAHEYGARFGYLITSNVMPLLDQFLELGIDVLIGVDPLEWDLELTKSKLGGKVCMWGGVNGHMTVEQGSSDDVRREVARAYEVLAPGGGFILSPVDNVREYTPRIQENVQVLIDAWRGQRK